MLDLGASSKESTVIEGSVVEEGVDVFIIGEHHNDKSPKLFIRDNLTSFLAAGIDHLGIEVREDMALEPLYGDLTTGALPPALQKLGGTPTFGSALEASRHNAEVRSYLLGEHAKEGMGGIAQFHLSAPCANEFHDMLRQAWGLGMHVVALDTLAAVHSKKRVEAFDTQAIKRVSDNPKAKWVLLVGDDHCEGIAEALAKQGKKVQVRRHAK